MSATSEQLAHASTDVSKRIDELSQYAELLHGNIQQKVAH